MAGATSESPEAIKSELAKLAYLRELDVWVMERTFGWIVKHRRCVRACETRPGHHEAVIHIAMIGLMTRRLTRT